MTRSVLLEAPNAEIALRDTRALQQRQDDLQAVVSESSRFAKLLDTHVQIVGKLIYLRLEFHTGDASGHNMVTNAADRLIPWILQQYPELDYVSISANYCTDKKSPPSTAFWGVVKTWCAKPPFRANSVSFSETTPEALVDLHIKKT